MLYKCHLNLKNALAEEDTLRYLERCSFSTTLYTAPIVFLLLDTSVLSGLCWCLRVSGGVLPFELA